jgi:hypothetical protein
MRHRGHRRPNSEGHHCLRIDLLEGGRYVGTLLRAVNRGYDALPSHSAKFNSERDNSPSDRHPTWTAAERPAIRNH